MSVAGPLARIRPAVAGRFSFRAMASQVNVRTETAGQPGGPADLPALAGGATFRQVEQLFRQVEAECTRFDPNSPLMQANAAGTAWATVPGYCFAAIEAAARAHRDTAGLFDPRVLTTLSRLGYDRSFPGSATGQPLPVTLPDLPVRLATRWQPELDAAASRVRIGPEPIDLGGIGKGLAVRWAAELLGESCPTFLIEAGGDCYLAGSGPAGDGWQVGIEDPAGGADPIAVLSVSDRACATSSIRVRQWTVMAGSGPVDVHHLIDPRTGRPGRGGLASVTVIGADPAWSEVWSKALFLAGRDEIAELAQAHSLAAVWVASTGELACSEAAAELICWRGR